MWFAKLFGGSRNGADDEPARFAAAPISSPVLTTPTRKIAKTKPVPAGPRKGFDPYNSGAFKRENAWETVSRRGVRL